MSSHKTNSTISRVMVCYPAKWETYSPVIEEFIDPNFDNPDSATTPDLSQNFSSDQYVLPLTLKIPQMRNKIIGAKD